MGSGRPLFPETDVRFMEVTQMEIEMSQQEVKHRIRVGRDFMKMPDDEELFISDQQKRLKQPPLAKAPVGSERISLAADFSGLNLDVNLADLMGRRESREAQYLRESMEQQAAYIHSFSQLCQEMRLLRHDARGHLVTVHILLKEGKRQQAAAYLEGIAKPQTFREDDEWENGMECFCKEDKKP